VITLAIETATQVVSVAIGNEDGLMGQVEITQGRRHAETLAPAIEFVCHHAQVAVADIAGIGVDVGPGLFTGMRVGIATAKTMAHALDVPIVGLSSLELLAHPLRHTSKVIASVIDARKGEVFYAFFAAAHGAVDGANGGVRRLSEPRACSIEDFNADVIARGQQVVAVGDGAQRYELDLEPSIEVADPAHPSAACLVVLARARILQDDLTGGDETLARVQPMYLRAPDAEINWKRR
jgi:tRNA threonylcarbamoyladenosine biosynthesis protein TsaB